MKNSETKAQATSNFSAGKIKNKAKQAFQSIKENRVIKAACYMLAAITGLLALGGLFRVVAWTMQGWNQLAAALRK